MDEIQFQSTFFKESNKKSERGSMFARFFAVSQAAKKSFNATGTHDSLVCFLRFQATGPNLSVSFAFIVLKSESK